MSKNNFPINWAGKGYYITLILCAAAIALTGILYYRNANEEEPVLEATDPVGEVLVTQPEENDVAVIATQPQAEAPVLDATQPTAGSKSSLKTMSPVSGEMVYGYAMETLSYNETTRDWRVHDGLDIAAAAGTEVVAAADGEVYTIYEDDVMGTTVVIRHLNGYTTKYSSLSEDLSVSVGDSVTMGQVIGTVGCTALVETTLGDHVHFSVTYQDKPMDPTEFLNMG